MGGRQPSDQDAPDPRRERVCKYSTCESDFESRGDKVKVRALVGRRVLFYWSEDKQWYGGKIIGFDPGTSPVASRAAVEYDDGEVLWENVSTNQPDKAFKFDDPE